jgi:general secretion pathway protein M
MIHDLHSWWQSRTARERGLLWLLAIVLTVILAWLLLFRPISGAASAARDRYEFAVQELARTRTNAKTIAALEHSPIPVLGVPIDNLVRQAAIDDGFPVTNVQVDHPNSVVLTSPSVRSPAFFQWVNTMENKYGLIVSGLRAAPNNDLTIHVEIRFRARRR